MLWQEETKRDLRRLDNEIQEAQDNIRVCTAIEAGNIAVASALEYICNGDIRVMRRRKRRRRGRECIFLVRIQWYCSERMAAQM
jgi:hypothetical protein